MTVFLFLSTSTTWSGRCMLLQLLFLLPVFILLVFLFMLGGVFLLATLTWSMLCVAWGTLNLNENEPRQQWMPCDRGRGGERASVRGKRRSGVWARSVNVVSPCTGVKIWRERSRTAILCRRNVRRAHFLFPALSTATSVELCFYTQNAERSISVIKTRLFVIIIALWIIVLRLKKMVGVSMPTL